MYRGERFTERERERGRERERKREEETEIHVKTYHSAVLLIRRVSSSSCTCSL
jgi:hypothetical protein